MPNGWKSVMPLILDDRLRERVGGSPITFVPVAHAEVPVQYDSPESRSHVFQNFLHAVSPSPLRSYDATLVLTQPIPESYSVF